MLQFEQLRKAAEQKAAQQGQQYPFAPLQVRLSLHHNVLTFASIVEPLRSYMRLSCLPDIRALAMQADKRQAASRIGLTQQ
jgi:hypothetical protein